MSYYSIKSKRGVYVARLHAHIQQTKCLRHLRILLCHWDYIQTGQKEVAFDEELILHLAMSQFHIPILKYLAKMKVLLESCLDNTTN